MSDILYLHGFASSPRSEKGSYFARQFQQVGATVHQPDLAGGDFRNMTLTSQLKLIHQLAEEVRPALVMGSSLGGYLTALYAALHPENVPAMVLLAPAFGFPKRWIDQMGQEKLDEWREKGEMSLYHYGDGRVRAIGYGFYEDSLWFDEFPAVTQPTLIFHGKYDDTVPPELSVQFAVGKPNVRLELVESDHRLTNVTDEIWRETVEFYRQSPALMRN